jgi:ribosomal protein S18 acetylase RimI-like enzyme
MEKLQEVVPRITLTAAELEEIKELELICVKHDGIEMKLNWSMLSKRRGSEVNDLLYYEDGRLAGFLGIYFFGRTEAEISGMVHPDFRRRGIFSALLKKAEEECRKKKFQRILLICPGNSASGKEFALAKKAEYSFSEYFMERKDAALPAPSGSISLRKTQPGDFETLVTLNQEGFSISREEAEEFLKNRMENSNDITLIAEIEGMPVGKIGLKLEKDNVFIYGFSVMERLRGKGYGRQILQQSIQYTQEVLKKKYNSLEVAAQNEGALHLYQSCGFVTARSIDYYASPL